MSLHLFEAFGVELEYMIVDRRTLAVRPIADRLLAAGGYLDFDDYTWSLRHSPSMNPDAFPEIEQLYSDEQIDARQVALVVDLLVRPDTRYEEIVPNKVFRKRVAP